MSKIYRITGNFMQNKRWAEPNPAFVGWICEEDEAEGEFFGFCEELYYNESMPTESRIRYLTGAFAPNGRNGNMGIAFYKLSNDPNLDPLMYVIPDLTNPNCGEWAAPSIFDGFFHRQGRAMISVIEDFSGKTEEFVQKKYEDLDLNNVINAELQAQVYCCADILVHAH